MTDNGTVIELTRDELVALREEGAPGGVGCLCASYSLRIVLDNSTSPVTGLICSS